MAETQLKATGSSGDQLTSNTQDQLQAAGKNENYAGGTKASSLQPNAVPSSVTQSPSSGVPLSMPNVSQIDLSTVSAGASQTQAAALPLAIQPHHTNPGLVVIPVVLVVIAAVSIWLTRRTVKSTT